MSLITMVSSLSTVIESYSTYHSMKTYRYSYDFSPVTSAYSTVLNVIIL